MLRRWVALRRARADEGFVLLEAIMAIGMITVIMTALTTLFVTTMTSAAHSRGQQAAIQVATSAVEYARGVGATDAVQGRTHSAVDAPWDEVFQDNPKKPWLPAIRPWLTSMDRAYDPEPAGRTPALSITPKTQIINKVEYTKNYFIGLCWRPLIDSPETTECGHSRVSNTNEGEETNYAESVRVVVAVTWHEKSCTGGVCTYLTAILLDRTSEPIFNFNPAPPPLPSLTCDALSSAVNDPVDRSILASAGPHPRLGCRPEGGMPPFTFRAENLPSGLEMASDGTVKGTPTTTDVSNVIISMKDGFLRDADGVTLVWTVNPKLSVTPPEAQSTLVNTPVTPVAARATGGDGEPYTWTASGLPDGIDLSTADGTFTGTPTAAGVFPIDLTATDKSGTRTASRSFTWTVRTAPPTISTPPVAQSSTISTAITGFTLTATGGTGPYRWAAAGLPEGIKIDSDTGAVSGTPTSKVDKQSVTITVTDAASQSGPAKFAWTVNTMPIFPSLTISTPRRTCLHGCPYDLVKLTTGGTGPYTYELGEHPDWVKLEGTIMTAVPPAGIKDKPQAVTVTVMDSQHAISIGSLTVTFT